MSVARDTLEKARFFLDEARTAQEDRTRLGRFIEAAIVSGRSVTFHLQKEFASELGFKEWYADRQQEMGQDALFRFFVEQRNFILKEGPIAIKKTIIVRLSAVIAFSDVVSVRVSRGKPWYRRSPRILLDDLSTPVREVWNEWRRHRRSKLRRANASTNPPDAETFLHFDDPQWSNRHAFDMIGEYFDKLERIVADAEARFDGASNASTAQ